MSQGANVAVDIVAGANVVIPKSLYQPLRFYMREFILRLRGIMAIWTLTPDKLAWCLSLIIGLQTSTSVLSTNPDNVPDKNALLNIQYNAENYSNTLSINLDNYSIDKISDKLLCLILGNFILMGLESLLEEIQTP